MIRSLLLVLSATASLCGAQNLFNGKDLTGWDGNPEFWRVENGCLVGETTADKKTAANTFLIWKGGPVADFEFTFKARVTGNNSGVQYRSRVLDPKMWRVGGYQMDMHPKGEYFAMLYEEQGRRIVAQRGQKVVLEPGAKPKVTGAVDTLTKFNLAEWNEFKVIARGNHLIHLVNGRVTVDVIDNDAAKRSLSGVLALQLHAGAPMKIEAKDLVLKVLKAKGGKKSVEAKAATPQWIWSGKVAKTEMIYVRRQWTQSEAMKSAKLRITCDNSFTAFMNGKRLGAGTDWQRPVEIDLKPFLRNGDNVLAVEAGNEGTTAGLVARIELIDEKGRTRHLVTDGEWLVSKEKKAGWMAPSIETSAWARAYVIGPLGMKPWGALFSGKVAAPAAPKVRATVHPAGFALEKLYDVPKASQGSWVSMAVDDQGRLYCGDQGGQGIFRVTLGGPSPVVERIPADISGAQGLLWAFDSLYVCLSGGKPGPGLYRVTDSDGDDRLDKVTELRRFRGGGEHGPHAVLLAPDGESLYVLGGNHTSIPEPETSAVISNYAEDQLLPRMPDARGHAKSIRAPGGWVVRTDKEGRSFQLYSAGFRNQYDAAFNADGELFTYDSDMEWDIGTPWYRPTRIYHVTSGSEFGWRTGTGKFPVWYPDTLPPALEVGPGSPTGVVSGLGAKFPAKYQNALYAFDWTYGTIYAMHQTPRGASYEVTKEEFVTGVPLNVSDGVIGADGNFYFAVGGRGTQSALYRVKYTGRESVASAPAHDQSAAALRELRRELETCHRELPGAVAKVWPYLGHEDRFIRYAARVALEHQPVGQWVDKALAETEVQAGLSALLALSRQGEPSHQGPLLRALETVMAGNVSEGQRLEALRVLGLSFIRMGKPNEALAAEISSRLSALYPAPSDALNRELVSLLVFLDAPEVVAKTVPLMSQEAVDKEGIEISDALLARSGQYGPAFSQAKESNPQRQQIWYAYALKNATVGWTPELRREFFAWFAKAQNFKGGNSFGGFIQNFRKEALAKIGDEDVRAAMDKLSQESVALVPEGYENARGITVGVKPGMKFDTELLTAKPGEKLAIVLVNNDPTGMMHNLAVITPGSRQKVITAAMEIGPKAIERSYIPDIPEVLGATPQVAPGRKYTLYLTIPDTPGDYVYVCTYPGHGQVMFGTLEVRN